MTTSRPPLLIAAVMSLIILWGTLSWYWYACAIKNTCGVPRVTLTSDQSLTQVTLPDSISHMENGEVKSEQMDTVLKGIPRDSQELLGTPSHTYYPPNALRPQLMDPETCPLAITHPVTYGKRNNTMAVKSLEYVLNRLGFGPVRIDGVFSKSDRAYVTQFQAFYKESTYLRDGFTRPTGVVTGHTLSKLNELYCTLIQSEKL
jgi:hypothetical protein